MQWSECFPPGSRVLALPSWESPRLYVSEHSTPGRRWSDSALYPAFRFMARAYRMMLRARAAAGLLKARTVDSEWALGQFVGDLIPRIGSVAVLLGTPSPAQKTTIQFRDETGRVTGYLKIGQSEMARKKLNNEYTLLSNLPESVAAKALKFGELKDGDGLLTTPIDGAALPGALPPPAELNPFLESLRRSEAVEIDQHPWIKKFRRMAPDIEEWLEPLRRRKWPVTFIHGDFAPWNVIRSFDQSALRAIDWEEGVLEGFPHIDAAYYHLQTAELIYRWPARRMVSHAMSYLHRVPTPALDLAQSKSIVRLAARWAYCTSAATGIEADNRLQRSRRAAWEVHL